MTILSVLQKQLDDLHQQFIGVYARGGQVSTYMDAVKFLSGIHSSAEHIIKELTENSVDAGATKVIVIIHPNRIEVIDNGSGLNPFLPTDDINLLQLYFDILTRGDRRPGDVDFDKPGSEGGQKSLGWMGYMVLKSQKRLAPNQKTRGTKGVGFQGVRQLSDQVEILSKPTSELASQYYADASDYGNPPVCMMSLPTAAAFEQAKIHPVFRFVDKTIGYSGETFASGTHIMLSQLRPGLTDRINLESFLHLLSISHGVDIRRGLSMQVVDRFTTAGRRGTGVSYTVQAPSYKGRLVLGKRYMTRGHKPFDVEVYAVGEREVGDKLTLRRRSSDVVTISETTIPELRKAPWNSRRLSGFIEFPDVPEADAPWNGAKTEPLDSSTRNQWLKALTQQVGSEIEEAIRKLDDELKMTKTNSEAKVVAEAFNQALRNISELSNFHQGVQPGAGAGTGKGSPHNPHEDRIYVRVSNQYNQGVTGVTLELMSKTNKVYERYTTGVSGEHSFGEWSKGNYRLRFVLPSNVTFADELVDGNIVPFTLPSSLGKGIRLHVRVNQPDAEPTPVGKSIRPRSYEVGFAPLTSDEQVFDGSAIELGKLVINSDNPGVSRIYRLNRPDLINSMIVGCLIKALWQIAETRLPGHTVEERTNLLAQLELDTMHMLSQRK